MKQLVLHSLSVQMVIRNQINESQQVVVDKLDQMNMNMMKMQAAHDSSLQTIIKILDSDTNAQRLLDRISQLPGTTSEAGLLSVVHQDLLTSLSTLLTSPPISIP